MHEFPLLEIHGSADGLRRATVGRLLRDKRRDANLRQEDVARALGYSSGQFVSNWERGESLPPPAVVPELAAVLRMDPAEIVEAMGRAGIFKGRRRASGSGARGRGAR